MNTGYSTGDSKGVFSLVPGFRSTIKWYVLLVGDIRRYGFGEGARIISSIENFINLEWLTMLIEDDDFYN